MKPSALLAMPIHSMQCFVNTSFKMPQHTIETQVTSKTKKESKPQEVWTCWTFVCASTNHWLSMGQIHKWQNSFDQITITITILIAISITIAIPFPFPCLIPMWIQIQTWIFVVWLSNKLARRGVWTFTKNRQSKNLHAACVNTTHFRGGVPFQTS